MKLEIPNFDTRNIKNMNHMFSRCPSLEQLDLSNFDIHNVQYIFDMFSGCSSLKTIILPKDNKSREKIIEQLKLYRIHCKII